MLISPFQAGDKVKYYAIGGGGSGNENSETTGKIVEVLTETQPAGNTGNTVQVGMLDISARQHSHIVWTTGF
jgi:hypothetical protein